MAHPTHTEPAGRSAASSSYATDTGERSAVQAMLRGSLMKCPRCGTGPMFGRFLKVREACPNCGQELHHQRADDAPPYVVMFIVGHVVIAAMLYIEVMYSPALWIHAALWLPLTLLMSFALLQPVKGALVGLQWANRMHGFDPDADVSGYGRQ